MAITCFISKASTLLWYQICGMCVYFGQVWFNTRKTTKSTATVVSICDEQRSSLDLKGEKVTSAWFYNEYVNISLHSPWHPRQIAHWITLKWKGNVPHVSPQSIVAGTANSNAAVGGVIGNFIWGKKKSLKLYVEKFLRLRRSLACLAVLLMVIMWCDFEQKTWMMSLSGSLSQHNTWFFYICVRSLQTFETSFLRGHDTRLCSHWTLTLNQIYFAYW